tara:strand:+ start:69 stop:638 length:570 start_codon:yes stop_codon:yes gene_type:complete
MNLKNKNILLLSLFFLFFYPSAKSAERIFLYKGNFSRTLEIEELNEFEKTKNPNKKLKNLINITNQTSESLHKILSHKIEIPIKSSSRLMNSKIGEAFLNRLSKVIYPNKISDIKTSTKAIRSGVILSSYKNDEKINLIDFFREYPNKNIAIDLDALNKALKKVDSLKELIDFYSNSPFQKLKDGRSNT